MACQETSPQDGNICLYLYGRRKTELAKWKPPKRNAKRRETLRSKAAGALHILMLRNLLKKFLAARAAFLQVEDIPEQQAAVR